MFDPPRAHQFFHLPSIVPFCLHFEASGFFLRAMRFLSRSFGILLTAFALPLAAGATSLIKAPHVEVELLSSHDVLPLQGKTWFGVSFKIDPEWHIYWKNPGDSGAAPKFVFTSEELQAKDVQWPVAKRIPFGDLTNIGYENEVIFPFEAELLKETSAATLSVKLEWLVCKEECIPGFGSVSLRRPAGEAALNAGTSERLAQFLSQVPVQGNLEGSPQLTESILDPKTAELRLRLLTATEDELQKWELFPVDGERYAPGQPGRRLEGDQAVFTVKLQNTEVASERVFKLVRQSGESLEAYEVQAQEDSGGLWGGEAMWFLLLSAVLGGMILNLMPCVFPVLSIKVFSFMKAHEGNPKALIQDGLWYTLGTLVTFSLLGAGLLILRQGGEAVGWGFQLQSPVVIFALAMLFFILALNFLGVFELGTSAMNWAGLRLNQKAWSSAFGTGVLSVLVAAPCTGPFMGAALGATAVMPALPAMLIFVALGFGLALPLLILCVFPAWLKLLPKPGVWMETLKEFFAFPLFATVLWLLWVLTQQTGADGFLWAGLGLVLVAFGFWWGRRGWRLTAILFVSVGLMAPVAGLLGLDASEAQAASASASQWQSFDEAKIEEARGQGQAVFIDFTAAWCITCQWNKKSVLDTDDVQKLFQENKVLLVRADWTRYDERITAALQKFGRASVPVYAYYAPGAREAKILPQILTPGMIEELF